MQLYPNFFDDHKNISRLKKYLNNRLASNNLSKY